MIESIKQTFWLLVITAAFGMLVYVFFRALFRAEPRPEPPEVVDETGWTLVVDGSNFAHRGPDVQLDHLRDVLDALDHFLPNARLRVFCDANLRYKFEGDDRDRFERLVARDGGQFRETHGQVADDVILEYAHHHDQCIVVSNDWFAKGDEVQRRQGIPLLHVERTQGGDVYPHPYVVIFDDPDTPQQRKNIPLDVLVDDGRRGR